MEVKRLNEEQFNKVINESVKRILEEEYGIVVEKVDWKKVGKRAAIAGLGIGALAALPKEETPEDIAELDRYSRQIDRDEMQSWEDEKAHEEWLKNKPAEEDSSTYQFTDAFGE